MAYKSSSIIFTIKNNIFFFFHNRPVKKISSTWALYKSYFLNGHSHLCNNKFYFCTFSEDWLLESINEYDFLTNGHVPVTGVDDVQEFEATLEAFDIMGVSPEDIACEYNCQRVVFKLGFCYLFF